MKALLTTLQSNDSELVERASKRVAQWQSILTHLSSGSVNYGSRTPLHHTPAWVTLEVATGGFATGRLMAGGPLETFDKSLIQRLSIPDDEKARHHLNAYFLTGQGLSELTGWLESGCYSVRYPEEGALLTLAWLCKEGHGSEAAQLLNVIYPYFSTLRFYPVPDGYAQRTDTEVFVQDVASTRERLRQVLPHQGVLAQRFTVQQWAPLHDQLLALFAETMSSDDWPCQVRPEGWSGRANEWLKQFDQLSHQAPVTSKYRRAGSHYVQLREYLRQCTVSFEALSNTDLERIRHIYRCSVAKRGQPDSAQRRAFRQKQLADVAAPLHSDIAKLMDQRLTVFNPQDGLDQPDLCKAAVSEAEATASVPAGTSLPTSLLRKIDLAMKGSMEELIQLGLISSGDTMALVLPQFTSKLHGMGIENPGLRQLYSSIYRAFRQRRSLLLLNLESQVRLDEIPWVSAIDRWGRKELSQATMARQALEQIACIALKNFPHALLPNRLVREMAELVKKAGLAISLVEELAADIFMGRFSPKFTEGVKLTASAWSNSLYARYYQIDVEQLEHLSDKKEMEKSLWPRWVIPPKQDLAQLCAKRAGVTIGRWVQPSINGMIIEQQQILTTHNLAALIFGLNLRDALQEHFANMAQKCFQWICARNQIKLQDDKHTQLIVIKNSAYAWRQMIFFLSMLPADELQSTLQVMQTHFDQQKEDFRTRFQTVFDDLKACVSVTHSHSSMIDKFRPFLGWSDQPHWLMRRAEVTS